MAKEMVKLYLHVLNNRIYLTTPIDNTNIEMFKESKLDLFKLTFSFILISININLFFLE